MTGEFCVIYSDSDDGENRVLRDIFSGAGFKVYQIGDLWRINGYGGEAREDNMLGKLTIIGNSLDFTIAPSRRSVVDLVGSMVNEINLVMMNRSNRMNPEDYDGFEAAKALRELGYNGRIALRTHYLMDEHFGEALRSGVDDIFKKGGARQVCDYVAGEFFREK